MQPISGEPKQNIGHGGFTDPAEGERGKRHAKLNGGQKLIDTLLELEGCDGARTAMRDQLLDAGLTNADEGKLGRDKETGSQDEEGDQNDAKEYPLKHLKTV